MSSEIRSSDHFPIRLKAFKKSMNIRFVLINGIVRYFWCFVAISI
jgi:hypothetical protein